VEAYRRALVVESALKRIYGIEAKVPDIVNIGFLNDLTIWAQSASDMLDRELDNRYTGRIGFALSSDTETLSTGQLLALTTYNGMVNQQKLSFSVASTVFEAAGMRDVLLRSVRVQIEGSDNNRIRLWPLTIKLPARDAAGKDEKFSTIASTSLSDVAEADGVVRGVHNINPLGDWELKLAPRSLTGEVTNNTSVKNIYLALNVSYRRL
jgi:hypothetical protein